MYAYANNLSILVGSWLTVSTVFLAGEIAYRYGAIAGVFTTLSFLFAFFITIPFLRANISFQEIPFIFNLIHLLYLFRNSMILFILLYFMIQVFALQVVTFTLISLLVFTSLYVLYTKINIFQHLMMIVNAVFIFSLAIFFPNYLYLQFGFESVYHNLLHYHPSTLYTTLEGKWPLFLFLTFIFFCYFFVQLNYLKKFLLPNQLRGIRKLGVASFIIGTLLLSFSTVTIVAITKDIQTEHVNALLLAMIQKQTAPFSTLLLILLIYILIFLEWIISLHIFQRETSYQQPQSIFLITVMLGMALSYYLLQNKINISILSLYLYFGVAIGLLSFILIVAASVKVKKSKKDVKNL